MGGRAVYQPRDHATITADQARDVGRQGQELRRELSARLDLLDAIRSADFSFRVAQASGVRVVMVEERKR